MNAATCRILSVYDCIEKIATRPVVVRGESEYKEAVTMTSLSLYQIARLAGLPPRRVRELIPELDLFAAPIGAELYLSADALPLLRAVAARERRPRLVLRIGGGVA